MPCPLPSTCMDGLLLLEQVGLQVSVISHCEISPQFLYLIVNVLDDGKETILQLAQDLGVSVNQEPL